MDNNLLDLCFTAGFWKGYLLLVKKLQLNNVHRKLIIALGDINLLSADNPLGYLPSDFEEWREFFASFAQSSVAKDFISCLSCDKKHDICTEFRQSFSDSNQWSSSLQWETISRVALSHIDSIKVIELLQELDIPNGAFTSSFYKALVMTFLIDKQQSALMHRTLTTVGSYLWSRKLQAMPPEARLVLQKEKEKPNQVAKIENKDTQKRECIYIEEPENHWGVKTSLDSVCKICKLPLTSHLSPSVGGVTVYRCGHSYHTVCSKEGFCIVCLSSNIDNG